MTDPAQEFWDAHDRGEHLFQELEMVDQPSPEGTLVVDLTVVGRIRNARGALQGGLVATLLDIVAGRLAFDVAPQGSQVVTADLNIHYLAPVMGRTARGSASIVRAGRRIIVVSAEVVDLGSGKVAAVATGSFAVVEPRPGQRGFDGRPAGTTTP